MSEDNSYQEQNEQNGIGGGIIPSQNHSSENNDEPVLDLTTDDYGTKDYWNDGNKNQKNGYKTKKTNLGNYQPGNSEHEKEEKSKSEILQMQFRQDPELDISQHKILHPQINEIAKLIKKRIKRKNEVDTGQDYKILITGGTGSGKSTLGIYMAMAGDKSFHLIQNMCYYSETSQIIKKFDALNRYQHLVIDEAIVSMDKMSFATREFRAIVRKLNTDRYQNKVVYFLIPSIESIAKDIRENEIDLWINIIEAGTATVHYKPRAFRNMISFSDLWDDAKKFIGRRKLYEIDMHKVIQMFEKHNTHLMTLYDIPNPVLYPEVMTEYNRLKELSRDIAQAKSEESGVKGRKDKGVSRMTNRELAHAYLLLVKEGKTVKQIAAMFNRSASGISYIFKKYYPKLMLSNIDYKMVQSYLEKGSPYGGID